MFYQVRQRNVIARPANTETGTCIITKDFYGKPLNKLIGRNSFRGTGHNGLIIRDSGKGMLSNKLIGRDSLRGMMYNKFIGQHSGKGMMCNKKIDDFASQRWLNVDEEVRWGCVYLEVGYIFKQTRKLNLLKIWVGKHG